VSTKICDWQNGILYKALGIGGYDPANTAVQGQYWHLLASTLLTALSQYTGQTQMTVELVVVLAR